MIVQKLSEKPAMGIHINPKAWNEAIEELVDPLELQGTFLGCIIYTHKWLPEDIMVIRGGNTAVIINLKQEE